MAKQKMEILALQQLGVEVERVKFKHGTSKDRYNQHKTGCIRFYVVKPRLETKFRPALCIGYPHEPQVAYCVYDLQHIQKIKDTVDAAIKIFRSCKNLEERYHL